MSQSKDPKTAFLAERSLHELAMRLEKNGQGKIAVHIHLSKLQQHRRRDQYIRIAVDTFQAQIHNLGGQVFLLHTFDVVAVCPAVDLLAIESAINRLRMLFQEDPLTQFAVDQDQASFCTWYRLDREAPAFANIVAGIYRVAEQSRSLLMQEQEIKASPNVLKELRPEVLGKLEQAIARADLSNVIRSQTACTAVPGQPLVPVFREYFVDIGQLQSYVTPGIELRGNRWLFQYLTAALDKRMFAHIAREDVTRNEAAFSLNMNVASVLTPEFKRFDDTVPQLLRGRMVVELQMIDIFADLGAYIFARDYLQERGYRVCLDGLTHMTLRYIDRARLGADLVKLYWTPEGVNTLEQNMLSQFKELVAQTGQARTILCRCEDEFALEFGRSAGILMFQGYFIERMLTKQRNEATLARPAQQTVAAIASPSSAPDLKATR